MSLKYLQAYWKYLLTFSNNYSTEKDEHSLLDSK